MFTYKCRKSEDHNGKIMNVREAFQNNDSGTDIKDGYPQNFSLTFFAERENGDAVCDDHNRKKVCYFDWNTKQEGFLQRHWVIFIHNEKKSIKFFSEDDKSFRQDITFSCNINDIKFKDGIKDGMSWNLSDITKYDFASFDCTLSRSYSEPNDTVTVELGIKDLKSSTGTEGDLKIASKGTTPAAFPVAEGFKYSITHEYFKDGMFADSDAISNLLITSGNDEEIHLNIGIDTIGEIIFSVYEDFLTGIIT
ncbi:hypothetical protein GUI12_00045 [Anaplasmataceae bacterium AB001_6]|nr:hypothetical protein GUI12_00045 [Anaplasmataceae bacterium AB001_6]